MRQVEMPPKRIGFGRTVRIEVAVHLGGLKAEDIRVELLLARTSQIKTSTNPVPFLFECKQVLDNEHLFVLEMQPELCGKLSYLIRAYPYHTLLTHPHEMGLMAWL